ncbi:MAG: FKBP-type peptidyl-prolyl cis-trans isomerase, partial [Planctomycetota bacterium]|nr:FKBP-type peptidyl-prolyl cis-trans isomerase [Planctomycetota bacterium]
SLTAGVATGQERGAAAEAPEDGPPAVDADLQAIAQGLTGSWRSDGHILRIARIGMPSVRQALYVELIRQSDEPGWELRPLEQQVWTLERRNGRPAIRAMQAPPASPIAARAIGMWAIPVGFPRITPDQLALVGDMVASAVGPNGEAALEMEHPAPTHRDGAIAREMQVTVGENELIWSDRGFDANGDVVWGERPITFSRFDEPDRLEDLGNGLMVIDLRDAPPVKEGEDAPPKAAYRDTIACHVTGYLLNGAVVRDSRTDPRGGFQVELPGKNIGEGFSRGVVGMQVGMIRRILSPPQFNAIEVQAGQAPQGAFLIYDVEVVSVKDNTPE